MESKTSFRGRKVNTAVDGSDLPERPVTTRQQAEVALERNRKAMQEHKAARAIRRFGWQDRLGRQSLRVEEEGEKRKRIGYWGY